MDNKMKIDITWNTEGLPIEQANGHYPNETETVIILSENVLAKGRRSLDIISEEMYTNEADVEETQDWQKMVYGKGT